jgi:hypothetical protein
MTFNISSSKSTRTNGERHHYTANEIDIYLLYSYVYDEVYLIPLKKKLVALVINSHYSVSDVPRR